MRNDQTSVFRRCAHTIHSFIHSVSQCSALRLHRVWMGYFSGYRYYCLGILSNAKNMTRSVKAYFGRTVFHQTLWWTWLIENYDAKAIDNKERENARLKNYIAQRKSYPSSQHLLQSHPPTAECNKRNYHPFIFSAAPVLKRLRTWQSLLLYGAFLSRPQNSISQI